MFETKSLGTILCLSYQKDAERPVASWLENNQIANPDDFTCFLLTQLCLVSSDLKDKSELRLTIEQSSTLTKDELEHFCQKFILFNSYILQNVELKQYQNSKDSDGNSTFNSERFFSDEHKRLGVDNCRSYLLYVIRDYHENYYRRMLEEFSGISKVYSKETRNLFEEYIGLSEGMDKDELRNGAQIKDVPPPPVLPDNPMIEINHSMATLSKDITSVSYLMRNMNDLGIRMNVEAAKEAQKVKRWNTAMFSLGLLTLFISAYLSYESLLSSNQSSETLEKLISEQNSLLRNNIELKTKHRQIQFENSDIEKNRDQQ